MRHSRAPGKPMRLRHDNAPVCPCALGRLCHHMQPPAATTLASGTHASTREKGAHGATRRPQATAPRPTRSRDAAARNAPPPLGRPQAPPASTPRRPPCAVAAPTPTPHRPTSKCDIVTGMWACGPRVCSASSLHADTAPPCDGGLARPRHGEARSAPQPPSRHILPRATSSLASPRLRLVGPRPRPASRRLCCCRPHPASPLLVCASSVADQTLPSSVLDVIEIDTNVILRAVALHGQIHSCLVDTGRLRELAVVLVGWWG